MKDRKDFLETVYMYVILVSATAPACTNTYNKQALFYFSSYFYACEELPRLDRVIPNENSCYQFNF